MKKNNSKQNIDQQLTARKAKIAKENLTRYDEEQLNKIKRSKLYRRILIFVIACIFLIIIPLSILGNYLYKKYTWQENIKKGMTRQEFESVLPYYDIGIHVQMIGHTGTYTVDDYEIFLVWNEDHNKNTHDDIILEFKIKKK